MKLLIITVLSLVIISMLSCNKDSITNPPDDNSIPGRRDYVWTVDTLTTQNNRIQCIWGSSPTDVWAGGAGGLTSHERLWHFDGTTWKTYDQYVTVFPMTIFGFAQNDVWMGGNDGQIFHYNGSYWNLNYKYFPDSVYTTDIYYISGTPDNMYAVGLVNYRINEQAKSFVLHYDGKIWNLIYLSSDYVQFLRVIQYNDKAFITGYIQPNDSISEAIAFYEIENDNIIKIFQKPTSEITWASITAIDGVPYFLIGRELKKYSNGNFQTILTFNSNNFGYQVYGRSLKDIFIRMQDGLGHYNGSDEEYLYHFYNWSTSISSNALLMKNDVFFIAEDYSIDGHIILKGTLNE